MRPRKVGALVALPRTIFLVFEVSLEFFYGYYSGGDQGQGTKEELITYPRSKVASFCIFFYYLSEVGCTCSRFAFFGDE